jgi:hypothetical protein
MRSRGVLASCALAGAVFLGSGAIARSGPADGESKAWSVPMGGAQNPQPTGGVGSPDQTADPAAKEAAQFIIDREEGAAGRKFDPAFRADVLKTLASMSLAELEAIRNRIGGGVGPSFLGSNTGDYVYNAVTPCRIIDTRFAGGQVPASGTRNFKVAGSNYSGQGGTAGDCGIPFGPAKAVVINFVAVAGAASGNLVVTAYGSALPNASIINWTAGVPIANGLPVAICNTSLTSCGADLTVQANASPIHVVADVLGYFAPPFATSLDVQIVYSTYFACASGFNCGVFQTCNTGYTVTGGGCQLEFYSFNWYWANSSPAYGIPPVPINGWNCQGTNTAGFAQNMRTFAMCSRVPGR